ncbi:MAG: hypothetical protein ACXVCY_00810 [Pseudobdellovibrionaceae bacterium]
MFRMILLFHVISSFAHADIGFSRGGELVATSIQGQVHVVCNGFNGAGSVTYTCREIVLDPNPYDYFVGPQDSRINKVNLTALHEDGSSREKVVDYDGVHGKTRDALNLWISTIFQKPLLAYGLNTIRYRLYSDNGDGQYEGNFNVTVKRGSTRQCTSTQYESADINDCNSQYSVCQRYFEENHNCRQ